MSLFTHRWTRSGQLAIVRGMTELSTIIIGSGPAGYPGDTLWSYASAITPDGGDVRDTIDDLISLNHLDGVSLQVGQQLKVPIV